LFEFHVTVVEPPKLTELGFAKIEQLGVCCCCVLLTEVWQVALPPGPLTVSVNVLLFVMLPKVKEPLVPTGPASVNVADVALFELQFTVVEPPNGTFVGFAEIVQLG